MIAQSNRDSIELLPSLPMPTVSIPSSGPHHLASPLLTEEGPGLEETDEDRRRRLYASLPLQQDGTSKRIRILTINRVEGPKENPTIEATLEVIDLSVYHQSIKPFAALSYCWGEDECSHPILCNQCAEVNITANCVSAIWHLYELHRRQKRKRPSQQPAISLTLWIDAVCINQEDEEEKYGPQPQSDQTTAAPRGQLDLMADIYSSAATSYFWLGEGNRQTDKAIAHLATGCLPTDLGLGCLDLGSMFAFRRLTWYWLRINSGVSDITSRDWVNRVWTLQECVLSPNGVVICGFKTIPWMAIVRSVQFYDVISNRLWRIPTPIAWHHWSDLVKIWLTMPAQQAQPEMQSDLSKNRTRALNGWKISGGFMSVFPIIFPSIIIASLVAFFERGMDSISVTITHLLFSLFLFLFYFLTISSVGTACTLRLCPTSVEESIAHEVLRRQCRDLRDKFFGVKELLANHTSRVGWQPQDSLNDIYHRLTIEVLQQTNFLDILLLGRYFKSRTGPSWVIDWNLDLESEIGHAIRVGVKGPHLFGLSGKWLRFRYVRKIKYSFFGGDQEIFERYSSQPANSTPEWNRRRLSKDKILEVQGCVIAKIVRVSTEFPTFSELTYKQATDKIVSSASAFRRAMEDLSASQIDACVTDLLLISRFTEPNWISNQVSYWRRTIQRNELDESKVLQQVFRPWPWWHIDQYTGVGHTHTRLSTFINETETALARCTGTWYSGLGIACQECREGDCIALISGLSLPLVLRGIEGGYEVVGPAFLGGLGDGKLWESIVERQGLEAITLK